MAFSFWRSLNLTVGLLAAGLLGTQAAPTSASPVQTVQAIQLPTAAVWLAADGPQVYAVTETAELFTLHSSQAKRLASNFSSHFITACSGRVVGVNAAGTLQVWNGHSLETAPTTDLSPLAHPVCLPGGVVAVSRAGDLVRFDPAAGGWREAARAAANALPDAQLTLADLDGSGPEVVALTRPSRARYDHGILGDAAEASELSVFERHGLGVLARLSLPAPFVFEDLQARPVKLPGGQDGLVVVRSSPSGGAALVLLAGAGKRLSLRASGPDFGQTHRWLAPIVGFGQFWAVQTPHIGGQLVRYEQSGAVLKASAPFGGVLSHSIGSRNLDAALLLTAGQLVVPAQDHRRLLALNCRVSCRVTRTLALNGAYSSNLLLSGAQVWVGDRSGQVQAWPTPLTTTSP